MSLTYIKYLPKNQLLFLLWESATLSDYFMHCEELAHKITQKTCTRDIINMMKNTSACINLTIYHCKNLFVDITNDYLDTYHYNLLNGENLAEKIITQMKKTQLLNLKLLVY